MTNTSGEDRLGPAVAATLAALATLWAFSLVVRGAPFPPSALGEWVLRATPGDVATFFIETMGAWARRLLALGALAGALGLGTAAAVRLGVVRGAAVLVPAAALAALASPSVTPRPLAVAASVLAAGAAFVLVGRAAGRRAATAEPDDSRRRALAFGAGAAAALATGGGALGWVIGKLAGPDTDIDLVPPRTRAALPDPGGFPDIPGLAPELTPVDDHYVVDINLVQPSVEADGWRLGVTGEVRRALEIGFAELQERFEVVEEIITLCCVSNEVGGDLVGNSVWGGVRLADVLEAAGVEEGAVDVVFHAADGYSDSIPLDVARAPAVLLAVAHNRRPLTRAHGFPCRVRIPSIYGMKNVKWLEEIEVVGRDYKGYWQERGWSDAAVVKTQSRIDVAGDGGRARAGEPTWIAGVAWAGDRGISKVEVSVDGGTTWYGARLKDPASPYSWSLWAYRWTPARAGRADVVCRATDGTGATQASDEKPPHPDGAAGYHRVVVDVA